MNCDNHIKISLILFLLLNVMFEVHCNTQKVHVIYTNQFKVDYNHLKMENLHPKLGV